MLRLLQVCVVVSSISFARGRSCVETSAQCYADSADNRVLTARLVQHSGDMTREACLLLCDSSSYTMAGVENGEQCFCGNAVAAGAPQITEHGVQSVLCEALFGLNSDKIQDTA